MRITINGNSVEIKDGINITDFLKTVENLPKLFVIEQNKNIIYKEDYDSVFLKDGDEIELVTFTGGG